MFPEEEVGQLEAVRSLAGKLAELLPRGEKETDTRARFEKGLVIIPDADFSCLMETAIPVQARVQLTGGKTTDTWIDPETGVPERGNLWYEEQLPPECLFAALVGERRQRAGGHADAGRGSARARLSDLTGQADRLRVMQIGGNETVGEGLCFWTFWPEKSGVTQ